MTLQRLVAYAVGTVVIAAFATVWLMFWTMYQRGTTSITIYADAFGEFGVEFALLTLAIIFLPTLLYEIDREVFGDG